MIYHDTMIVLATTTTTTTTTKNSTTTTPTSMCWANTTTLHMWYSTILM